MDEFKMWAINGTQATPVSEKNMTDSEDQLEEILVNNSGLLMPNLTLVGRQMETGAGPLDLLGVDSEGRLVLFELKRDKPARVAVAQVIDYASALEAMGVDRLAKHITDSSEAADGIDKIENFSEWHEARYPDAGGTDALLPMRMFLVGLGVKDGTDRMVNFLANKNVDISLLTFQGFEQADGQIMLMRVKADADSVPSQSQRRKILSEAEKREQVRIRAEAGNVQKLFNDVREMFREKFDRPQQQANTLGITMSVPMRLSGNDSLSMAAVVRVNPEQEQVRIVFYDRSVELCREDFRLPMKEIGYETWSSYLPLDRHDTPLIDPQPHIHFLVREENWETHKDKLSALAQAMYAAIQKVNESDQDSSLRPANSLKANLLKR